MRESGRSSGVVRVLVRELVADARGLRREEVEGAVVIVFTSEGRSVEPVRREDVGTGTRRLGAEIGMMGAEIRSESALERGGEPRFRDWKKACTICEFGETGLPGKEECGGEDIWSLANFSSGLIYRFWFFFLSFY